jgi:dTDP-glucose pyrophosphorylase
MSTSFPNNRDLKALILAGGRGSRLEGDTSNTNKCMLKFGGKYLIEYSLDNVVKLDVKEIVIVVGHLAEQIINVYGNNYSGITIKYIIQWEQIGLVNAIECAKNAIGNSDFILSLGDEFFYEPDHGNMIRIFKKSESFAICGVIEVDDSSQIRKTYSVLFDENNKQIMRLIEKPVSPQNNLMGTGNIIFNNAIFDYTDMTPINQKRGERELPDLIQCAIDDGKIVLHHKLSSKYVNVNTPEDITIIEGIVPK